MAISSQPKMISTWFKQHFLLLLKTFQMILKINKNNQFKFFCIVPTLVFTVGLGG